MRDEQPVRFGAVRDTGRWLPPAAVVVALVLAVAEARLGDVAVYRAAARSAFGGGGADLYRFRIGGYGFTYPPFAALVLGAVGWLPTAGVWVALDLLSLGALRRILRLSLPVELRAARRGAAGPAGRIALLVLALPVAETFRFGQVDLVLAAAVLTDLLVQRRGVLLGLAIAVKLTPAIFLPYLLLRRRYREAAVAVATFGASVVLGACVLPGASRAYWLHGLEDGSGTGGFAAVRNQSIHGLLLRTVGEGSGPLWVALCLPIVVGGLLLARTAGRSGNELLAVGTVGVVGCLVSPLSWDHHWVWVVPALAGLRASGLGGSRPFRRWLTAVTAVLATWTVLPTDLQTIAPLRSIGTGLVVLALTTTAAALATSRRRDLAVAPIWPRAAERAVAAHPSGRTGAEEVGLTGRRPVVSGAPPGT